MLTNARLGPSGHEREMRIGIGLPAAVPGVDATTIGAWAAQAERAGFASVGVIDRLVYDNLEPLTALAAAAARTEHVELFTTVLGHWWRRQPSQRLPRPCRRRCRRRDHDAGSSALLSPSA
jgi:alkanesulfonate monooxygenase SsuD/methylene tetrahydromethanopterin reductase-like flavin-dependent oxidoreductase (luciferase family)